MSPAFLKKNLPKLSWLKSLSQSLDLTTYIGFLTVMLPGEETQDWETTAGVLSGFDGGANASSQFLENSIIEPRTVLTESAFSALLSSGQAICLLAMSLGIPLFNAALNDVLFSRLMSLSNPGQINHAEKGDLALLTDKHLNSLAKANESLVRQLTAFIEQVGGVFVSDDSSPDKAWALPTKSYYWSDGCRVEWGN